MGFTYQLMVIVVQMTLAVASAALTTADQVKSAGCPSHCGDVEIPFPFGTKTGCFLNKDFFIRCDNSSNSSKPFLNGSNTPVINITIDGQLRVMSKVARSCNENSTPVLAQSYFSRFTISDTENKFIGIGCDRLATLLGSPDGHRYVSVTGCFSSCDKMTEMDNGSCNGRGCCHQQIPRGLRFNQATLISVDVSYNTDVALFNSCSYALIVEESKFSFNSGYLDNDEMPEMFPVVLDWTVIGQGVCEKASNMSSLYACKENAECYVPYKHSSGYRCRCKDGYHGNPYVSNGCQDIDECKQKILNNCTHKCVNEEGSYTCKCRKGYFGDGRRGGEGCIRKQNSTVIFDLVVGISCLFLPVIVFWVYLMWKRRKLIKLKEKFFQQNGGFLLQEQLAKRSGSYDNAKLFTAEELKKATNNYAQDRIVGRGGYGTVYKGFLSDKDNYPVAIKKSKVEDKSRIEQFINEVVVLSQINHKNVVKLLGCCLETEVPLLVYEFVSNGTLFQHIHNRDKASTISWETRLRIAAETADVLSYLHSAASIPIIHRDVKSSNILLDDNYKAKVSDFGASKLVPMDVTQLSTMVQGTLGYLDPEYMHTSQLTEKSDVYSFGVVLVELMTGKKPILFDRPEKERNLVVYFLSLWKEGCLFEIIENHILNDGNKEQLQAVAELATMCVRVKGEERPTMREVATELERLIMMKDNVELKHAGETSYLICETSHANKCDDNSEAVAGYDSFTIPVAFDDGR